MTIINPQDTICSIRTSFYIRDLRTSLTLTMILDNHDNIEIIGSSIVTVMPWMKEGNDMGHKMEDTEAHSFDEIYSTSFLMVFRSFRQRGRKYLLKEDLGVRLKSLRQSITTKPK